MVVLHCKTMPAGARANVTTGFWQLIRSMFISRKWEYEPIRQFKLSVLLCILCKCNCRRSSSHCKSATQFAPQKCVSLITEKFPKEEGGQWPTSVTHFAKMTYLRPPTRLFHSPSLRRLGLWRDRSKHPWGRDVEQSSPRPDWIQNRQAHPGGRSQKLPPEAEQWLIGYLRAIHHPKLHILLNNWAQWNTQKCYKISKPLPALLSTLYVVLPLFATRFPARTGAFLSLS